MKPLTVLFKADCLPHVEIAVEIRRALTEDGQHARLIGLTLESLNPTGAYAGLMRNGVPVIDISRVDASSQPVWQDASGRALACNYPNVLAAFEAALQQTEPDVFVLPYDVGYYSAAFLRSCRQVGVPSLLVQEGVIIRDDGADPEFPNAVPSSANGARTPRIRQRGRRVAGRVRAALRGDKTKKESEGLPPLRPFGLNGADVIAAIGPHYRRLLLARGVAPDCVFVTGLPRFDLFWRLKCDMAAPSRRPRTFPQTPVALCFQNLGFFYGSPREVVLAELQQLSMAAETLGAEYRLVVRLRPEEDPRAYESWVPTELPLLEFLSGSVPLQEHLRLADVAIGSSTTAQIEAMMLGLPVIDFDLNGPDSYGFVSSGAALPAYNASQLVEQIRRCGFDAAVRAALAEGRRAFLTERVLFDGRASERVARLLHQMRRP